MSTEGQPDSVHTIEINFPPQPCHKISFGFIASTPEGKVLARGMVDKNSMLHDYHGGIDNSHRVPDSLGIDVKELYSSEAHTELARRCVAAALFEHRLDPNSHNIPSDSLTPESH